MDVEEKMKVTKFGRIPMDLRHLQLFAEGAEDGLDAGATDDKGAAGTPEWKAPASQSEYDAAINKAVQAALKNHQTKSDEEFRQAVEEEIKRRSDYSKLSKEEQAKKDLDDERAKLESAKAEFAHQQLVLQVEKDLVVKGLPVELAETFALHNDATKALESVGAFEKAFKEAVAEEVKRSARQDPPRAGSNSGDSTTNYGVTLAAGATSTGGTLF